MPSGRVRPISLHIVAVQATIDERHYAAVYLGDDEYTNHHFRIFLNGKAVSTVVWDRRGQRFKNLTWTVVARNLGLEESFVWPNEIHKKLVRKLTEGRLYRMVKIR